MTRLILLGEPASRNIDIHQMSAEYQYAGLRSAAAARCSGLNPKMAGARSSLAVASFPSGACGQRPPSRARLRITSQ